MNWLRWVFFESFLALAVPLFLLNFFLLVGWRRSGRPRPLLIGLAVSAVLLLVQAAVVTRHEHAAGVLRGIEAEIPLGQVNALSAALARGFDSDGMSGPEFVAFAQEGLRRVRVLTLRQTRLEITRSDADSFVAIAVYLADTRAGESFTGLIKSKWEVTFVHEGGAWRIGSVRALEVNNQPVANIRELRP